MAQPKRVKAADQYEGFGAVVGEFGAHIFRVDVPATLKGDITITEDFGLKGGENGVPPKETRVVLPRRLWSGIAEAARKDFAARLKAKRLTSSRWTTGDNKVDRMLGKELCVLAWAAEHANSVDECKAIAAKWSALRPEERWWLFSQTVAEAGQADDKEGGWRKALFHALSGGRVTEQKPRSIRPVEEPAETLSLF
ncbi:anti-phage-associated DUF3780 domain-containing protein [Rhodoferax ferrireducens]|uniref:anti-phage-associated DUF3780 domain-containing protein n=1 Tax=Rhodoferax ferrireducens TaxID=192843 RepID=UPI000E0D6A35|nr:anti-phage-associated DUF3780 domain-containing protein [Rhodoferax ferrireducens]